MGRSVQWAILEDSLRSENRGVLPQESCQLTFAVRVHGELQLEADIKCFVGFDSIPGCAMWLLFSFI